MRLASRFGLLLLLTAAASCSKTATDVPPPPVVAAPPPPTVARADRSIPMPEGPASGGLDFALSARAAAPSPTSEAPEATVTPLSRDVAEALLAKLPALPAPDARSFAKRDPSKKAPKPGKKIDTPFPARATDVAATPDPKPLTMVRHAPDGDVALAPRVSMTFSKPMVALTTHDSLAAEAVPARLEPDAEGSWRWVGTKTLTFVPKDRLPMATAFTVSVPAGVKSADGTVLAEPERFAFRTPPAGAKGFHPSGRTGLDPVLVLTFDQRVDPASVVEHVAVRAGRKAVKVALADDARLAADEAAKRVFDAAPAGYTVALALEAPLPTDTRVKVDVRPGIRSLEGPRVSTEAASFSFTTYPPLRFVESACAYGKRCAPLAAWTLAFNNALDRKKVDVSKIVVRPELPDAEITVRGSRVIVQGASKGRTRYRVTFPADLTDVYGQQLGKDTTVTVEVGSADQRLWATSARIVTLPPEAPRAFVVETTNVDALDVRVHRVTPDDWLAYLKLGRRPNGSLPGTPVTKKTVRPEKRPDEVVKTAIDLTEALRDGLGHAIVDVTPSRSAREDYWIQNPPKIAVWVQSTKLALDLYVDAKEAVGWVTDLSTGAPLADVELRLAAGGAALAPGAKSKRDGLVTVALPAEPASSSAYALATRGDDVLLVPETSWYGGRSSWAVQHQDDYLRFFVFDDRHLYRPGEHVHVKGWIRREDPNEGGDLGPARDADAQLAYRLIDAAGQAVANETIPIDRYGGFDLQLTLPDDVNLGHATFELELKDAKDTARLAGYHRIQIQEFRRPEFEVTLDADVGPYFVGEFVDLTAHARYFSGGGLANAEAQWRFTSTPAHYAPPGHDRFSFGAFIPWWRPLPPPPSVDDEKSLETQTDERGETSVRAEVRGTSTRRPATLEASVTVMDVNRQAWSAKRGLLVHPADVYVGLSVRERFVAANRPVTVDALVVDVEGRVKKGRPVALELVRIDGTVDDEGRWKERRTRVDECERESAGEPVECSLKASKPGVHELVAVVTDKRGRRNETVVRVWVSGGAKPTSRPLEGAQVELVFDKKRYEPGDTARVLVVAPFLPAQGLLTIARSGLVEQRTFEMTEATKVLEVLVEDDHVPNLEIDVELVGRSEDLPAFANGSVSLPVSLARRRLNVLARSKHAMLEPGETTELVVDVVDHEGRPLAAAQVAIAVADEAVIALAGERVLDPLEVLYTTRPGGVRHLRSRHQVVLQQEEPAPPVPDASAMDEAEFLPMAKSVRRSAGAAQEEPKSVALRKDFSPVALFAPAITTDDRGRAVIPLKLPDSLTRYRILAVATDGAQRFGFTTSNVTAKKALMVRPSPPRFSNFGDRFSLPVVVQNQTNGEQVVSVAARASNLALAEPGWSVTIPAFERVEVLFDARAEQAGSATVQLVAASPTHHDAAQIRIPVWTPATSEAFAVYGDLADDGAVAQPIAIPDDVLPEFGGLSITTSATQLAALTDAVLYLARYPYACNEQLASRVLAISALADVLEAFDAPDLPSPAALKATVEADLDLLAKRQTPDGGWGWWNRRAESRPFATAHVLHAFARAGAAGYRVPKRAEQDGRRYLATIESHLDPKTSKEARQTMRAYALYVRALFGDVDGKKAAALIAEAGGVDALSLEAVAFLYRVLPDAEQRDTLAAVRRRVENAAVEEAGTAHFATGYGEDGYLVFHSDRRVDALLLEGLLADVREHPLVPKLVRGLLAHRRQGRWTNTQENAWALLALHRYFKTYERVTPNFVARVWLNDTLAAEHAYEGRTTEHENVEVPMATLVKAPGDLVVEKRGAGRLYYRLGLSYAPKSLALDARERGFAVTRRYEAVQDASDVTRDDSGAWVIRAGAEVRVTVTMATSSRRYHVALVDALPAGFEPLDPALAMTANLPPVQRSAKRMTQPGWWPGVWYEHQNLRDERAEAFASRLAPGVHTYSYIARATTPGRFVAPPAKAEEMYFPEVFGRSATDVVLVR